MPSWVWTVLVVLALIVLFVYLVYDFRKPKEEPEELVGSIENVLTPTPGSLLIPEEILFPKSRDAVLYHSITGEEFGEARRGTKDGEYFHTVKAGLSEIDREIQFYEGWLVSPIPYNFFSTGEMVTNDLGEFILEFEGEKGNDYSAYTQVVITLEAYKGPSGPNTHIAEGEFKD